MVQVGRRPPGRPPTRRPFLGLPRPTQGLSAAPLESLKAAAQHMTPLDVNVLSDTTPLIVVHSTWTTYVHNPTGGIPVKRSRIPQKASQKLFTRTAQKVHPKNTMMPMRGGIRA